MHSDTSTSQTNLYTSSNSDDLIYPPQPTEPAPPPPVDGASYPITQPTPSAPNPPPPLGASPQLAALATSPSSITQVPLQHSPSPSISNALHALPQPTLPAPSPPGPRATSPSSRPYIPSRTPSPDKLDPQNFRIQRKKVDSNGRTSSPSAAPVAIPQRRSAVVTSSAIESTSDPSQHDLATSLEERFSRLRTNSRSNASNAQVRNSLLGDTIIASSGLSTSPAKEKTRYSRPLPMPEIPPSFVDPPASYSAPFPPDANTSGGAVQSQLQQNHRSVPAPRGGRSIQVLPSPGALGGHTSLQPQNNHPLPLLDPLNGRSEMNGNGNAYGYSSSPVGNAPALNNYSSGTQPLAYPQPKLPADYKQQPRGPTKEFDFPKNFTITPEELYKYLQLYPGQILIIDIRPREYFNNGHLPSPNAVCFEPVAIHPSPVVTDETLEQALVLSPDHEQHLFQQRHQFPLVVYYDASTRNADFLNGRYLNDQDKKLSVFIDYLYRKPKTKHLKRPPALLLGGLEAWIKVLGKDKIWKSATLPPDLPMSASALRNPLGAPPLQPISSSIPNNRASLQQPLHWNPGYTDNSTFSAPQVPQVIPSRPYGSRKGSTASPNHRLSFDSSSLPSPTTTSAAHDIGIGATTYNYARNTNDFFNMPPTTAPQSLQSPYPPSRATATDDFYSFPMKNGGIRHVDQGRLPNGIQRPDAGLPKPPPPVAHVPQSQSQYPHAEINSGYAMGHAPGDPAHGPLPPIQNLCAQGPGSGPLTRPQQYGLNTYNPDSFNLVLKSFSTGLTNLGNSCYMNCIIQCIAATEKLAGPIVTMPDLANLNSRLGYKGILYSTFSRLLQEMIRKDNSYVSPVQFRKLCGSLSETFSGYQQQDCHEFLNFLLDGLHEELNRAGNKPPLRPLTDEEERIQEQFSFRVASAKQWQRHLYSNNSPITTLVQGQYLSRLTCTVCKTTSTTYNAFSCLSLPIPPGNHRSGVKLVDCFRLFTVEEVLDGDNAWHCPHCKKRQRTTKTMKITRLPEVLIIHLKRFKQQGKSSNKLETFVSYPTQQLDLTEFWVRPTTQADEAVQHGGQFPPFLYNLYGVATHQGTLKGGHYTSFVKRGKSGWCYFDDTRVYRNVNPNHVVTEHAYVLFFERVRPVH